MKLKLYFIWRGDHDEEPGYDTYRNAVVAAKSKKDAKKIHPHGLDFSTGKVAGGKVCEKKAQEFDGWCDRKYVKVEYIGKAKRGTKCGVICADFNAG